MNDGVFTSWEPKIIVSEEENYQNHIPRYIFHFSLFLNIKLVTFFRIMVSYSILIRFYNSSFVVISQAALKQFSPELLKLISSSIIEERLSSEILIMSIMFSKLIVILLASCYINLNLRKFIEPLLPI